ncbi:MAG: site-2 protease family protein [Acidobacteria bacterium]|nr:site-2 protease family protein [Acidobacteriota bacterium]MBV9475172.1 site-2 protease family protein [Acidobacteriota bacterium]
MIALKMKALLLLFLERGRAFFVNPFEGFGAMQYAVAGGSFVVTIAAYATQAPLAVVIGFVVITLIHEIGHAVAIRMKGLRAGFMVFIPFVGGAVTLKDQPRSAFDDAIIGLAGPAAGTAASLVTLEIYKWQREPTWLLIALLGFALNLMNLIPIGMLDGGRISAAVTKWMWVLGGGAVVYKVIDQPNPLIILIAVLAAFQVYASIVREKTDKRFYEVTAGQRAAIAVLYFALVIFLGHQTWMAYARLELLRR